MIHIRRRLALALVAATAAACSSASRAAPPPATGEAPPTLRLPGDTRPTAYQLELAIDPTQARFSGRALIRVQLDRSRRELWLHGRALHVTSASVRVGDAAPLPATWQEQPADGFARLTLPSGAIVSARSVRASMVGPSAVTAAIQPFAAVAEHFASSLEGVSVRHTATLT